MYIIHASIRKCMCILSPSLPLSRFVSFSFPLLFSEFLSVALSFFRALSRSLIFSCSLLLARVRSQERERERETHTHIHTHVEGSLPPSLDDDDCFYYHSWRKNVGIAFGTLSS